METAGATHNGRCKQLRSVVLLLDYLPLLGKKGKRKKKKKKKKTVADQSCKLAHLYRILS